MSSDPPGLPTFIQGFHKEPFGPPYLFLFSMAQQPLVVQGLLIMEDSRSYSVTPHLLGLPCMSEQPVAETLTFWRRTFFPNFSTPCI